LPKAHVHAPGTVLLKHGELARDRT